MKFIDSLTDYKRDDVAKFDTTKQTTGAIVKELLPQQLTQIKKNYKKFTQLIDLLNYYVNNTVPKINTKVMLQSWVRKLVKEKYGEDSKQYRYLKAGFSMTTTEKKNREGDAQATVVEKNENQTEISAEHIKQFNESLLSPKWKIIPAIIMAQLASGCRLIEILSSDFTFEESKKEGYIIQNDVAKNRTDTERQVEKPVLFLSAKNFIRLMKIIRDKMTRKEGDDNIILSNRYGKRVNAKIKKLAQEAKLTGITSSHDMRKIYANLSYDQYAPKNCSLQGWVSCVLGHGDTTSAIHYSTFKII